MNPASPAAVLNETIRRILVGGRVKPVQRRHGHVSRIGSPSEPRSVELPTDLAEWDGWCLELVNELLGKHPDGDILYVELGNTHPRWTYHAAIVVDGIVHDAWHPDVRLPPAEYIERVFGSGLTWELNPGSDEEAIRNR